MLWRPAILMVTLSLGLSPVALPAQRSQGPPYRLEQVERLLRGEVRDIISELRRTCIAFEVSRANAARLNAAGADSVFIQELRSVCQMLPRPGIRAASECAVWAMLEVVRVREERREYGLAFRSLDRAADRLKALTSVHPGHAAWDTLKREIDELSANVLRTCEAWRQIQLERDLAAPECRRLS